MLNDCLKVGDVQSGLLTATSCSSACGRGVGSSSARGLDEKKDCILNRDRWSAALLLTPAMCSMLTFML